MSKGCSSPSVDFNFGALPTIRGAWEVTKSTRPIKNVMLGTNIIKIGPLEPDLALQASK